VVEAAKPVVEASTLVAVEASMPAAVEALAPGTLAAVEARSPTQAAVEAAAAPARAPTSPGQKKRAEMAARTLEVAETRVAAAGVAVVVRSVNRERSSARSRWG